MIKVPFYAPVSPPKAAFFFALLIAAMPMAALSQSEPTAGRHYEGALARFDKKDYNGAVIQLKNALQADRNMLPAHVLMGKALMATNAVGPAEVAFTEALRLGANRAEVVVPMARASILQGKIQDVIDQARFQPAGLPSGTQAQLLLIRAGAYSDLGDQRGALRSIEEARALDPGAIDTWLAEVSLRIRARQFKEALTAVAKARAINPESAEMHYQHGSILHVQGDRNGALAAYDKALSREAKHVDARIARIGLYVDLKRDAEAAKDVAMLLEQTQVEPRGWYLSALLAEREGMQQVANKALAKITELLDPVPIEFIRFRPQLLLLNGQAHYGLGEREKAKPYFEIFQRTQPGSPAAKLLANIYLEEKNYDRALEALESYLRSFPGDSQALALLASAHMAQGRHARASALMQQALRNKDAPELYTAYGLSLLGTGQSANALAQLETAYKKDPEQTQAAFALVGLYLRSNQGAKALNIANALVTRQPNNPSYQNLLGLAKTRNGDVGGARAAFEAAIKIDPLLQAASLNLARLEMSAGNREQARALLEAVLKSDEKNTEAMYEFASQATKEGRRDEALRWLQRAFDVGGVKDLRSSLALVDFQLRAGLKVEALKSVQQLFTNAPEDLSVLLALGRALLANGDFPGAGIALTTAAKSANSDAPVQVEIATLQIAAQNVPGAAYSLEKALAVKPDHLPAHVLMTEVETRKGEFVKAEQRARQILKREPKLAIGYSLLGDLELTRNQVLPALEAYRKGHQVQPSTETLGRLFRVLSIQDAKAAVQLVEQWLKGHPSDVSARRMLAEGRVRNKDLLAAKKEYEQLQQLAPKDVGVLNDLANVLVALKDPKALEVAEAALALQPKSPITLDTAGWAAFQAGQPDRAVQLLRDARLRNPESAVIRYHLAATLMKLDRKGEAREELDAALRSKQGFDGRDGAEALLRTLK